MHLHQVGNSETSIALVPGGPCLPGYLHDLRDLLADTFCVQEIDLRDSLLSKAGPPYSMEGYFEDLSQALAKGRKKSFLLGHSAGAVIALAYAAKILPKIDGLILLNPGPLSKSSQENFVEAVHSRNAKLNSNYLAEEARLDRIFAEAKGLNKSKAYLEMNALYWPAYFTSQKIPESIEFRLAKPEAFDPLITDYYRWKNEGLFLEDWESIPCPVLMIHGDYDPIPFQETRDLLRGRIQDFEFSLIKDAGHFPWYEKPEELRSVIEAWVK